MLKTLVFFALLFVQAGADAPIHECTRPCHDNGAPKTCRYRWVLENYLTLSRACYGCPGNQTDCLRHQCVTGDGVRRSMRTANRIMPGPEIQVCEGDTIEVEVVNSMVMGEGVTIHWHGLHQRHAQHMDGVAMVTQCPIPAASTFVYRFPADQPGTHFWHAHSGLLLSDGLFGSLVIRQSPSRDPHSARYDADLPDHVIVLNDWSNQSVVETYTEFYHEHGNKSPRSILINGRGRLYDEDGNPLTNTPQAEFKVEKGKRYRFRVIGAGSLKCPLQLSIEDHDLSIIASDGRPVEPLNEDYVEVYTGERYDFVLSTDRGQPGDEFIVRVRGLIDCQPAHLEQFAVLRYLGDTSVLRKNDTKKQAGHNIKSNQTSPQVKKTPVTEMTSLEPDDESLTSEPDHRFYLDFRVRGVNNPHFYNPALYPEGGTGYPAMFTPQINGISNLLPSAPLLTQMEDLDQSLFCNSSSVDPDCYTKDKFCECVHMVTVAMGDVVEVVVVSSSSAHTSSHPLHAHGHSFRVVAMERLQEDMTVNLFKELDEKGEVKRRLHRAPYKDTVAVPDGGYAVLRFVADNPGVWFFHCHLAFHVEVGMSLFLHVPDSGGKLPPPPLDFPRCGSWPSSDRSSAPAENRPLNEQKQGIGSASFENYPIKNVDYSGDSTSTKNHPIKNVDNSEGSTPSKNNPMKQEENGSSTSSRSKISQETGKGLESATSFPMVLAIALLSCVIAVLIIIVIKQRVVINRHRRHKRQVEDAFSSSKEMIETQPLL